MDIYEALYTTRAMRRLRPDPIPFDAQARILDAAIRAPHIAEGWRFLLVDDTEIKSRLAELYQQAAEQLISGALGDQLDGLMASDTPIGRTLRSSMHLRLNFANVPLLLFGFSRDSGGSGVYPALWSAMLAARAEGIGSTLTGMIQSFYADEAFEILGVPRNSGWFMHGTVAMGYPTGRWGIGERTPVHKVAYRNRWDGDLGFEVPEPLWSQ